MKRLVQLLKSKNTFLAFLFFGVFWIIFLASTETLTSGYHFTDDHGILTINEKISEIGFFETLKEIIITDLNSRFRPFYFINRLVEAKLFKTNIFYWSVYSAVLAILTFHCLFLFMYRQGYKFVPALLFPFLALIGAQSTIWWRLGPAESIGIFSLSVSLFFLTNSIYKAKKKHLIISIAFLLFSSLSKESFSVFLPSYGLVLLLLNYQFYHGKLSIIEIVRRNIGVILFLSLIFTVEAVIIVFAIGTNGTGYAGFGNSFVVTHFIYWVYISLLQNQYIYLILVGVLFLLQNIPFSTIRVKKEGKKLIPFIMHLGILMLIVFPQYLMYFKSGLDGRYLVPINIGFAYALIFVLDRVIKDSSITLITKIFYLTIVVIVNCSWLVNKALPMARQHTKAGISTSAFLSSISKNTQNTDSILVVVNSYENYELSCSLKKYLRIKEGIINVNFYIENQGSLDTPFKKGLHGDFKKKYKKIIVTDFSEEYSCIVILPSTSNGKVISKLDNNPKYRINDFGGYTVYTHR